MIENNKVVFTGLESAGKSYMLAIQACELVDRNAKWLKQQQEYLKKYGHGAFSMKYGRETPYARPIFSRMKFLKPLEDHAKKNGIPIIYWKTVEEMLSFKDGDMIIDELMRYFDARNWSQTSEELRGWIPQTAKIGLEIYAASQDFAQIELSFRRLVNELYWVSKWMGSRRPSNTKPPVKNIWGLIVLWELDPNGYNEQKKKFKTNVLALPGFYLIERKYCEVFDTKEQIGRIAPAPLRHVEYHCEDPLCLFHKVAHV